MVLSSQGGAYRKIAAPMKFYMGAVPGSGKQLVPWIHLDDVVGFIMYVLKSTPVGLIHVVSNNSSMKELTQTIALKERSKIILPNIPSFMIRLIFGEMGMLLTESLRIDHTKLTQTAYKTRFNQLSDLIYEKEN
jgi:NAD dependent epimerase/dehydratase family enzyme